MTYKADIMEKVISNVEMVIDGVDITKDFNINSIEDQIMVDVVPEFDRWREEMEIAVRFDKLGQVEIR